MAQSGSSVWLGICIGTLVSIIFGFVYLVILHEPGSAFYQFIGLVFLVGPLSGGIVAMMKKQAHRRKTLAISGGMIFGITWMLFLLIYLVVPLFDRTSVQLPAACDGYSGNFNPPPHLVYTLTDARTGILITEDAQFALVAVVDYISPPFPSTAFLIDKHNSNIVQRLDFPNDVISAAIDEGTLYLYNDKIGYFIDAHTGELENDLLTIDNYGGLSEKENPILLTSTPSGHWYMETRAVITSLYGDGRVEPHRHLMFNGIARGCFIHGSTHTVMVLGN